MNQRGPAFDSARSDTRLRCILCESLLPDQTAGGTEQEPQAICVRCWSLSPDERRLLRDRAMARVLRGTR